MERELTYDEIIRILKIIKDELDRDDENSQREFGQNAYTKAERDKMEEKLFNAYSERVKQGRVLGGNNKNKPMIYKNKIILGKERGIYKIPGSRKDYIKYKGKFIAVKDFIK
ncbi:MAG: hypothetical protein EBU84_18775 [Actinobacteria bacterium]|nr:hypothetical protein [Actinomycetota bacterium]